MTMNHRLSNLGPALVVALALLAAAALAVEAPASPWAPYGAPALLVLAVVGTDIFLRRRAGRGSLPSASVLIIAASILVASAILASSGRQQVAEMVPFLRRRQKPAPCRPSGVA